MTSIKDLMSVRTGLSRAPSSKTAVEENIKVVIRVRPCQKSSSDSSSESISIGHDDESIAWETQNEFNTIALSTYYLVDKATRDNYTTYKQIDRVPGQSIFTFDKIFKEDSTNAQIYTYVARDMVEGVTNGRNAVIFAYGQTSSGKTHTMQGGSSIAKGSTKVEGLIHMAARDLFLEVAKKPDREYSVKVSVLEVYNEEIRDLLSNNKGKKQNNNSTAAIHQDRRHGVTVDCHKPVVHDYKSLLKVLAQGEKHRTVASNALNERSSRSHLILSLYVESNMKNETTKAPDFDVTSSTLHIVDLAGSEGSKHKYPDSNNSNKCLSPKRSSPTKTITVRSKRDLIFSPPSGDVERKIEASNINKSLLALSRVITTIGGHSKSAASHVSYRDSKLTRLLQPALSGNSRIAFICCIRPSSNFLEESRATLQFASRIKFMKTTTQVNTLDDKERLEKCLNDLTTTKNTLKIAEEKVSRLEEELSVLKGSVQSLTTERDEAIKQRNNLEKMLKLYEKRNNPVLEMNHIKKFGDIAQMNGEARALEIANNDLLRQVDYLTDMLHKLRKENVEEDLDIQLGINTQDLPLNMPYPKEFDGSSMASLEESEITVPTIYSNAFVSD